jgi:hypothetical protein
MLPRNRGNIRRMSTPANTVVDGGFPPPPTPLTADTEPRPQKPQMHPGGVIGQLSEAMFGTTGSADRERDQALKSHEYLQRIRMDRLAYVQQVVITCGTAVLMVLAAICLAGLARWIW